ncbi:ParM/StbA family protein [Bacillus cereus]
MVNVLRTEVIESLYTLDLGNGFSKRKFNDKGLVEVDSSVIAQKPTGYNSSNLDTYSLNKTDLFYLGRHVIKTKLKPQRAQTIDKADRYFSERYELMLYAFIAKDFPTAKEIKIPILGLMLPNEHYAQCEEKLKQKYTGSKVITVSGVDVTINITDVLVLPQPLGSYMYALSEKKIKKEEEVLVCDGGAGTFDPAVVTNNFVTDDNYSNEGVDNAYIKIRKRLIELYGELPYFKTLSNIPLILQHGVLKDGDLHPIAEDKVIVKILDQHLESIFEYLLENQYNITSYGKVLWTGGLASLHKDRLASKPNQNFVILGEEGQEANVLGLWKMISAAYRSKGGAPLDDGTKETSNVN